VLIGKLGDVAQGDPLSLTATLGRLMFEGVAARS